MHLRYVYIFGYYTPSLKMDNQTYMTNISQLGENHFSISCTDTLNEIKLLKHVKSTIKKT